MITHASYIAANPLPAFRAPLRIEYGVEPPVVESRTHRIAKRADSAPKLVDHDDYVAALSTTEWRCTSDIAESLEIATQTVTEKMALPEIVALTERRRVGSGGRYEWRLK